MITLNITIGGNLCIELEKGAKEELKELIKKASNTDHIIGDLLENSSYRGNGWEAVIGVLTERPIIGWGAIYDGENDFPIDYEKCWHYPSYEIQSFAQELLKKGKVIFKKVNS